MNVEQQLRDVLGVTTLKGVTSMQLAEALFDLARIRTSPEAFYSLLGLIKRAVVKFLISDIGETVRANPELAGVYLREIDDIRRELDLVKQKVIAARDGAATNKTDL